MTQPLVTIITPTYNHEQYIGPCIESVLDQRYPHWEQIVVDDGSVDATAARACAYASADPRVRYVRQANRGIWRLSETYNRALAGARGELIAVLEGDDRWPPEKLAEQVRRHREAGWTLSFGQAQLIDAAGALLGPGPVPDRDDKPFLPRADSLELYRRLLYGEYFVPSPTVLIERAALEAIGGFQQPEYLPLVDYPTWLTLGLRGGSIGFIEQVLGQWRQFGNQTTWVHSLTIARGAMRYSRELAVAGAFQSNPRRLLSANRRAYLADASYRAAALAFERGEYRGAAVLALETARYGRLDVTARCAAMMVVKLSRRLSRRAARPAGAGSSQ